MNLSPVSGCKVGSSYGHIGAQLCQKFGREVPDVIVSDRGQTTTRTTKGMLNRKVHSTYAVRGHTKGLPTILHTKCISKGAFMQGKIMLCNRQCHQPPEAPFSLPRSMALCSFGGSSSCRHLASSVCALRLSDFTSLLMDACTTLMSREHLFSC